MAVFLVKSNENTYPKGRALMQMYRVVPIMKRGNYQQKTYFLTNLTTLDLNCVSFVSEHMVFFLI